MERVEYCYVDWVADCGGVAEDGFAWEGGFPGGAALVWDHAFGGVSVVGGAVGCYEADDGDGVEDIGWSEWT